MFFAADTVIISVEMRPLVDEVNSLKGLTPDFVAIGNCIDAGQVKAAIRAGYDAAINIGT